MSNLTTLLKKDFYEIINNPKKWIMAFGSAILLLSMVNMYGVNQLYFENSNLIYDIILIMTIAFIFMESTLFQTSRYIKYGVFEKYYLNKKIKVYQIYVSKLLFNILLVFLILIINYIVGIFTLQFLGFQLIFPSKYLFIKIIIFSNTLTSLGFISALTLKSENNVMFYMAEVLLIFAGYYKLIDILHIYNDSLILLILIIIMLITNILAFKLCSYNRLISK